MWADERYMPNCAIHTVMLGELPALSITHAKFRAIIVLQGGQLIDFCTVKHLDNWLWQSQAVSFRQGVAIRGGIPICFPLFGNLMDNATAVQATFGKGMAKHGLARTSTWQLIEQQLSDDVVIVKLGWQVPPDFIEQYPHIKLAATLSFQFSENGFDLSLESHNTSEQTICFSQAFHSYLPTADICQTHVSGFDKVCYVDMLADNTHAVVQQGDINFQQEVDRIYQASPKILLNTPHYQAVFTSKNSLSTVIWNPWVEKSQTLDQFLPNDYQKMLCIETANAGSDYVTLKPDEKHTLSVSMSKDTDFFYHPRFLNFDLT